MINRLRAIPLTASEWLQVLMIVLAITLIAATAVYASAEIRRSEPPRAYFLVLADVDCSAFQTRDLAQHMLLAIEGDPFNLDGDDDGVACEDLPERP